MYICVDFDGTCVTHDFPRVGKDIGAESVLKQLVKAGHKLILFTMRSSKREGMAEKGSLGWDNPEPINLETDVLYDAILWFNNRNIPLYGVNTNPTQKSWTKSPKAYGQLYIDDAALGCPLVYDDILSDRPFVDWRKVEQILIDMKLIK